MVQKESEARVMCGEGKFGICAPFRSAEAGAALSQRRPPRPPLPGRLFFSLSFPVMLLVL